MSVARIIIDNIVSRYGSLLRLQGFTLMDHELQPALQSLNPMGQITQVYV